MTTRCGIAASLVVYGLAHAVIDAISAGILLTLWMIFGMTIGAVIALYLALRLAFGRLPTFFYNVHE